MTSPTCATPIADQTLIEYWLGELDQTAETRIDEHVLACVECSDRLAQIVAVADGTRTAFTRGTVRAFVTDAFVRSAAKNVTHVREYRVPCNGSVNCTIAPEDELLVARLEAPLGGVSRIDALSYLDDEPTGVLLDIPFDVATSEVVLTPNMVQLRAMPSHRRRYRLVAIEADGERVIGDYTFNHTAHEAA